MKLACATILLLLTACSEDPQPGEGRWMLTETNPWSCRSALAPPAVPLELVAHDDNYAEIKMDDGTVGDAYWYWNALDEQIRLDGSLGPMWRFRGLVNTTIETEYGGIFEARIFDGEAWICGWTFTAARVD